MNVRTISRILFGILGLTQASITNCQEPQTPKNNDPALIQYKRMIEEKDREVFPIFKRAEAFYNAGKYGEAETECRRAYGLYAAIRPYHERGILPLFADILLEVGKYSEAIVHLEELRRPSDPRNILTPTSDNLAELVIAYLRVGNTQGVPPIVGEMVERVEDGKECAFAWNELSKLRFGGNANWEALAWCVRAGNFYENKDRNRFILKAAELAPNNAGVCLMYGEALRRQYRWREAKAQLLKAASASGKCAERAKWVLKQGAVRPPTVP